MLSIVPSFSAKKSPISNSKLIWQLNAFVDATPISEPACVYIPEWVSLAIDDPTTLQIPYKKAPFSLAIFIAASVSAVSPDCDIGITMSPLLIIGFLYLNSEAYSTSTGILSNSSKKYSPNRLECQDVPQEIKIILFAEVNFS